MKPKADNLFHFTKSLDILKLILENGIQPKYCLEDFEWFGWNTNKYLAYPMSCFCDIPLSRITEHTNFYGNYGIGLSKNWGYKNNLVPVVYSPPDGDMLKLAKFLFLINLPDDMEKTEKELNPKIFKLLSLIKPIHGKMIISSEVIEKEFYQENEWRFVPNINNMLSEKEFNKNKEKANEKLLEHTLYFSPQDIRYLFVKDDNDIPALVDFINEKLGKHPHNDLKILMSRIVSLKSLCADL